MERKITERTCELLEETLREETKTSKSRLSTLESVTMIERLLAAIDHLKDLDYKELKTEYYETVLREMESGRSGGMDPDTDMMSGRRGRDRMGRFTSHAGDDGSHRGSYDDGRRMSGHMDDDYMDAKRSYRSGAKNSDDKRRMLDALERDLDDIMQKVDDYCRDADCAEEKDMIRRVIKKMNNMVD